MMFIIIIIIIIIIDDAQAPSLPVYLGVLAYAGSNGKYCGSSSLTSVSQQPSYVP